MELGISLPDKTEKKYSQLTPDSPDSPKALTEPNRT